MNTQEARIRMLDLAREALEIVEGFEQGARPTREEKNELREMVIEARDTLPDAGYPGEAAWRGLQRASIGTDTFFEESDPAFWQDVIQELQTAAEVLESLVSPGFRRETDFHIIG